MLIRVGFDMSFASEFAVPVQLLLRPHSSELLNLRSTESLIVEPEPVRRNNTFVDAYGNRGDLIVAPPGGFRLTSDLVVEHDGRPDAVVPDADQLPV